MLTAAFSHCDITPDAGSLMPGGFAPRRATGVLDPLGVHACVLNQDGVVLAIVGVDAVSVPEDVVVQTRKLVRAAVPSCACEVWLAASHTHCGGPSNDVLGTDADPEYQARISEACASAVCDGLARLHPASVASCVCPCSGWAHNRRWHMRGGGERTNPGKANPDAVSPAGPVDPDVGSIFIRDKATGEMLGALVNFACHSTVISGSAFSADYSASWRAAMRRRFGQHFAMVFLNGACGDINQLDFSNPNVRETGAEWAATMGEALATAASQRVHELSFNPDPVLKTAHADIAVGYRRVPSAQLKADLELVRSGRADSSAYWLARDRVLLMERIEGNSGMNCPVDAALIGDCLIAAAPWQPFCEFGLRIKQSRPGEVTLVSMLTNGSVGYVPTPQAFLGGGYEPTLCRGSNLEIEAGDKIVSGVLGLIAGLR